MGALLNPKVNFGNLFQTFTEVNSSRKDYDQQSVYSKGRRDKPFPAGTAGKGGSESLKTCLRIWSGFTKFIRSQCNKGRIIDSQHLGTFYRDGANDAGVLSSDPAASQRYVFALGGKSNGLLGEFKMKDNAENVSEVPEELLIHRDSVSCNVMSIAQVCNCLPEHVTQFLGKFKEQLLLQCLAKRKNVVVNLLVGQLFFSGAGTVEFKSISAREMEAWRQSQVGSVAETSVRGSQRGQARLFGRVGKATGPKQRPFGARTPFKNGR